MKIDKEAMIDTKGAARTQSLFLETSYADTQYVQYTLKPRDHMYKGRLLPSIKRLYLEFGDVTEYYFAYEYFLDWDHWQQIRRNELIAKHIDGWSEEMEIRRRADGIESIVMAATDCEKPNFQAAKYLADGGWNKKKAGRPSKEAIERETKIQAKVMDEFGSDLKRLQR